MSHHHDHGARNDFTPVDTLRLEANTLHILGASVLDAADIGTHAVEFAIKNWPIIPLNGKLPAIPNPHPKGSRERQECHAECARHGHGLYDATTDIAIIASWWGGRYAGCNSAAEYPDHVRDRRRPAQRRPRIGCSAGEETRQAPETLMTLSGAVTALSSLLPVASWRAVPQAPRPRHRPQDVERLCGAATVDSPRYRAPLRAGRCPGRRTTGLARRPLEVRGAQDPIARTPTTVSFPQRLVNRRRVHRWHVLVRHPDSTRLDLP